MDNRQNKVSPNQQVTGDLQSINDLYDNVTTSQIMLKMCYNILFDDTILSNLPVDSVPWEIKSRTNNNNRVTTARDHRGILLAKKKSTHLDTDVSDPLYKEVVRKLSLNSLETNVAEILEYIYVIGVACLYPADGVQRCPVVLVDKRRILSQIIPSVVFPFLIIDAKPLCNCLLLSTGNSLKMCHFCGYLCGISHWTTCSRCLAVSYCSLTCLDNDKSHQQLCLNSKVMAFIKLKELLADFPFTFVETTTADTFNSHQLSEFLKREGIYRHGLWRREEPDCAVCSEAVPYGDLMVQPDPYVLPLESLVLENSNMPAPIEALKSWKEYYEWRGFHLSSPIAMLMHHVLTIYHIIQISELANRHSLNIILAGADKEVDLAVIYSELCILLPQMTLSVILVGPLISEKLPRTVFIRNNLEIKVYAGMLQHYLSEQIDDCSFDVVICLNAGLSAYSSWREGLMKVIERNIPCYVTDYCLLSIELSQQALSTLSSNTEQSSVLLSEPSINPFRDPKRKQCDSAVFPWYSHAFISKLIY